MTEIVIEAVTQGAAEAVAIVKVIAEDLAGVVHGVPRAEASGNDEESLVINISYFF